MPKSPERYSLEKATEEASQMQEKIKSGEAKTYDEAEKLIEEQMQLLRHVHPAAEEILGQG